MLIFIIIRSDYYYSRTLVITEFASSSCRTKRNGLDLRVRSLFFYPLCLLHGDIREFQNSCKSVVAHLQLFFNFLFPRKTKKIFTLHFTRYARFASYLEENRDRYVCFRTNRFSDVSHIIPLPRFLQPSLPFLIPSLTFSLPLLPLAFSEYLPPP